MIPSRALIWMVLGLAALGVCVAAWGRGLAGWWGLAATLAAAAFLDAARALRLREPSVTRLLPSSFPVAAWSTVQLRVAWAGPGRLVADLFDHHPGGAESAGLPVALAVPAGGAAILSYRLRPRERGRALFGRVEILRRSPWRLWQRRHRGGAPSSARVHPDFRPLTRYALLAVDNRTSQLGVRLRPRRGEGIEIDHLREYRVGDTMRQIDWKATSRQLRLISREYQAERNQQVVFLLDCGRSMRALEGDEPHFDHALRSVLLLTYVAIRQGDAVGVMTFGGREVWLPPVKGRVAMKAVLDVVHDLETTTGAPDYLTAAARLMGRQRRRSFVVIISNLRDEDDEEIAEAMRLMGRRHLVLLASLRETTISGELEHPPHSFEEARRAAAAHHYLAARRRAHAALGGRGVRFCDVIPSELPVTLVNRYLDVKRAGRL